MKNIDKIIFNELASRKSVGLPDMGALYIVRIAANMVEDQVVEPVNTVMFATDWPEGTVSIIDLITSLSVDPQVAQQNYYKWLEEAKNETGLYVGGTGVLKNGKFYVTKDLDRHLNPKAAQSEKQDEEEEDQMETNRSRLSMDRIWMILIPLFIAILAIGWGWWWYSNRESPKDKAQNQTTAITETQQGQGEGAELALDGEATAADKTIAVGVAAKSGTLYHVVGGVFSVPSNADNLVNLFKQAYPNLKCEKIPFKGMTIVSIYNSANEGEAVRMRNKISDELYDQELWVYKVESK